MGRNYAQLFVWSMLSGAIWIFGGTVHDPHTRLLIWAVAAAVDMVAPIVGFRLPLAGATPMSDWKIAGAHLAERSQLLLMIAFGESFLRIGESFARTTAPSRADSAFIVGFVLVFSLWTVYFLHHAGEALRAMEQARRGCGPAGPLRLHLCARGDGRGRGRDLGPDPLTIERPREPVSTGFAAICIGGPCLYLDRNRAVEALARPRRRSAAAARVAGTCGRRRCHRLRHATGRADRGDRGGGCDLANGPAVGLAGIGSQLTASDVLVGCITPCRNGSIKKEISRHIG